jgi:hypothetical protein
MFGRTPPAAAAPHQIGARPAIGRYRTRSEAFLNVVRGTLQLGQQPRLRYRLDLEIEPVARSTTRFT